MTKRKRSELAAEAERRNGEQLARLGGEVKRSRHRRRLTQEGLGAAVELSRSTIGAIEHGQGGSHTVDTWQRIGVALDRPLIVDLARDPLEAPADAGHLAIQELALRLAKPGGYRGIVELPTRPSDPRHSADVAWRHDAQRRIVLLECWNSFGDIGAAVRSTNRKLAEADALATALWGEQPHTVAGCWIVRASRRNRELVARYPELFAARFPGSSHRWVLALTTGAVPPDQPGLVWCDVGATRVFAWRRRE